jgi:ribosomal subunit interface protein
MNIQIDGSSLEITPQIRQLIDEKFAQKLDQLLPDFNNEIKTAFLRLAKDKYQRYTAKFEMSLPGQDGQIVASHQHQLLVSAITGLREAVEKQIKKYKQDKTNYSLG